MNQGTLVVLIIYLVSIILSLLFTFLFFKCRYDSDGVKLLHRRITYILNFFLCFVPGINVLVFVLCLFDFIMFPDNYFVNWWSDEF